MAVVLNGTGCNLDCNLVFQLIVPPRHTMDGMERTESNARVGQEKRGNRIRHSPSRKRSVIVVRKIHICRMGVEQMRGKTWRARVKRRENVCVRESNSRAR